jgi:hypothetical protein
VTPTPLPDLGATATSETVAKKAEEAAKGSCNRSGGPASAGMLGLLLFPVAIAAWQQAKARRRPQG